MSTRRKVSPVDLVRDSVLFTLGVGILCKQSGLLLQPPEHVSITVIGLGLLLANTPLAVQVMRFLGPTFWRRVLQEQPEPESLSPPSSAPSRGSDEGP